MHKVVIWGSARELLGDAAPASLPLSEVRGLAQLTSILEAQEAALVLCDAARLEEEHAGLQAWLKRALAVPPLLVAVAAPAQAEALLLRCPFLDDLWPKPLTPGLLRRRLDRALDTMHSRRVIRQLDIALA